MTASGGTGGVASGGSGGADGGTAADVAAVAETAVADTATADAASADGGGSPALPDASASTDAPNPARAGNLTVLPWAGKKAAVSYTFDDAQPSHFQHWPEIKATGFPVTYFVTTTNNWIAGYDATLKEVASLGHELGNHTVNHCNFDLTGCANGKPLASVDAEIDQCTDYLTTKLTAAEVSTMAYPYGDSRYRPAAQSRFFLGRGTGAGPSGHMIAPGDATDPFNLPVVAAFGGESAAKFSGDIDTARAQGKWMILMFHSLGPTPDGWYATVDISAVTGSLAHAKAMGDVWVDTMANVGAYWMGEKLIEGRGPLWTWKLPNHFPKGKFLRVTVDGGALRQGNMVLPMKTGGHYEVALDAGSLSWSP